jgi:integrase
VGAAGSEGREGKSVRTVPVPPAWVKELLDAWLTAAGIQSGPVFRPVSKTDVVAGKALTENSIWWIVREYAGNLNLGKIAPHDVRSYAVCRVMPSLRSER